MTVKLTGFKELDIQLGALPRATGGNVLSRTLLKAAEPMKDKMVQLAPDDPRTGGYDLHTSISAKKAKGSRYDTTFRRSVEIGPYLAKERTSKGKEGGRFYAAKALELGLGDMPLKAYVRPAFDETKDETVELIKVQLKVEIDKAVARRAKKGL